MKWLLVVLLVACRNDPGVTRGSPEDLALYLRGLAGADQAARRTEVAGWIVDEATWRRTIVEPFRALWSDYTRAFDAAVPALVARLAKAGEVTARRHFAGDPRLTLAQARLRWAVPVQYPSVVAELDGAPIDTVFIFDGTRWRALAGLDEVMLVRIRALDPACAARVERAGAQNRCTEVAWMIADAALRADAARFAHGCQLAVTLCGNGSP